MAFDPENVQYVLVEFALDSETWRIADEEVTLSDGTRYLGLLESVGMLHEEIGRLLDPALVSPALRLVILNTESVARTKIDETDFPNREVTIKMASSENAADVSTRFVGTVQFPGGIGWDDERVTLTVTSRIDADERVLPIDKFFPSDYPNMETKSEFLPIPLVYGDWRAGAGGGETVPCFQIDSTAGVGGEFKIADHALKEIEVVYLDGVDITGNCTLDAANAEFTLDSDAYDPDLNTVTVNVQGATDDGTPSGTRLDTLPDALQDLLETHLAVDASKIDTTAFSDWEGNLSATGDIARRWIGTEVSSNSLISELLVAGFADMIVADGKYKPVYRVAAPVAGIPTYFAWDIVDRTKEAKAFRVMRDPELVYANQIVAEYRYDPVNGLYTQRYDVEDAARISEAGTRRRRRLSLVWHYVAAGAEARADRELWIFSQQLETLAIDLKSVAVEKKPTDQFRLAYSKYEVEDAVGTPFQLRITDTDFRTGRVKAQAWNMTNLSPGRWTPAGATTWLLSTAAERNSQGYWTDAAGYADPTGPPDAASKASIWF